MRSITALRRVSRSAVIITATLVNTASLAAIEFDPAEFIPVEEVERGMKGFGLTVFEGTQIDTFQFEVLGVERGSWPQQDLVWGRMAGGPLEKTGIIAGMSGSPVYLEGRLLGAVAYGWGSATEPLCGITPIGEMLTALQRQERDPPGAGTGSRSGDTSLWNIPQTPWDDADPTPTIAADYLNAAAPASEQFGIQLSPVATPLMISGIDSETFDLMAPELRRMGFLPAEGGGSSRSTTVSPELEPGSAVGVQLVRGDMNMQSFGTLTYRRGDDVIAFGHPMRSLGQVSVPMTTMDVHFVVPNIFLSFKFGSVIESVGTVAQDRSPAISGRIGPQPSMIPIEVRVRSESGDRKFNFEVVDDYAWAPYLIWYTTVATIGAAGKINGEYTIGLDLSVELSGRDDPLAVGNRFSSVRAPYEAGTFASTILTQLLTNPFEEVEFESVLLDLSLNEHIESATLESVRLDRHSVRPGDDLEITITTNRRRGEVEETRGTVEIPPELQDGLYEIRVYDARNANMIERWRAPSKWTPSSVDDMIELIGDLPRNDELNVALFSRRPGVTVGSVELTSLPPSRLSVMASSRHSGETALTQGTIVARQTIRMKTAVSGLRSLPVSVDRSAR